jgi:Putative auto-transporter adhesin, head GIN domain
MYQRAKAVLLIVLAVLLGGCGLSGVQGSGNVVSESRDVSGISGVELSGDGNLDIEQSGTESLTISADDNILPLLKSEVRGGRLILGQRDNIDFQAASRVRYKLSVKNLNEIGLSGDGHVDAKGVLTDKLKISISGDGDIRIAGNAEEQEINVSGDGSYKGQDLNSKIARVNISGDGSATLLVSEKLYANISGDGSVEYSGNPAVTQNVSGDGSVRKR